MKSRRANRTLARLAKVTKIGYLESFRPLSDDDYRAWYSNNRYSVSPELFMKHKNRTYLQVLLHSLEIRVQTRGRDLTIKFNKGFIWDTASSPKLAKSLVDNDHQGIMIGALFHDALYQSKYFGNEREDCKLADGFLYDIMEVSGGQDFNGITALGLTLRGYDEYKDQSEFDLFVSTNYLTFTERKVA